MARYIGSVRSPVSPEQAFDYLADFSSVAEWDPSAVRARMLADAPGPGTEFEVVVRFVGREPPRVSHGHLRAPASARPRAETSTVVSEDTITVRPAPDEGSVLTYEAELRPKGPMRLADPVLGLLFRRLGDNAAAGLRAQLGAQSRNKRGGAAGATPSSTNVGRS